MRNTHILIVIENSTLQVIWRLLIGFFSQCINNALFKRPFFKITGCFLQSLLLHMLQVIEALRTTNKFFPRRATFCELENWFIKLESLNNFTFSTLWENIVYNLNIVFLIVKRVTRFSVITVLRETNARKRCKFCKMCYVGQILFSVEQILISYNWFGNLFICSIAMWNKRYF